jgi:sulfoacetaldehyde dehydrogenase
VTRDDTTPRDATDDAHVARARTAQRAVARADQVAVDAAVLAAGWAIMEPARNRMLAERAVADTGIGDVGDKIRKNHRKTLGLLRDLAGAKSVGVIAEDAASGITEIARPVGVVAAITPSTNPAATPANNVICALKGANAVILAPSPKGAGIGALLVDYIHAELAKVGAPADLVQILPPPVTREATQALMAAADLVVATGSAANVRAAYRSGTPALGVGAGNVAVIVDPSADAGKAASLIAASKTFDHATSCSSENSVIAIGAADAPLRAALEAEGGVFVDAEEKAALARAMWQDGRLATAIIARPATAIAAVAGLVRPAFETARFLVVDEDGVGPAHPFSGEKLSPVLAYYRVPDFDAAKALVARIYGYQGAGHSVGIHTMSDEQPVALGRELPVARVIVNQAHCFATGGSFDNGLPFSLSMGCGTWGRNSFSDNLNYRHYLNITRVARVIPERVPRENEIFGAWHARYGR